MNKKAPYTITAMLGEAARRFPERLAVVIPGERTLSYQQLADATERLAAWMSGRGVGPSSRVVVCANNGVVPIYAFLAAARIGASCVPLSSGLSQRRLKQVISETEPQIGLGDAQGAAKLAAADVRTVEEGSAEYTKALRSETKPIPPPNPESIALITYTSGTSSVPKGVCLSQGAITYNAAVTAASQEFGRREVYLTSTPMSHATAAVRVFTMLNGGHTHVVMRSSDARSFDAGTWMEVVETHEVTSGVVVPTQINRILDHPSYDPSRLESLRLLVYGAGPSTRTQVLRMMEELTCGLYHGYGLSEACTIVTALGADDHKLLAGKDDPRLGSIGRPVDGSEVVLRKPDGTQARHGEIYVRTPKLMSGYWRDTRATAAALSGGWLKTGDLACVDEEGYLTLIGRSGEMIISGGVNISPAQVERAVASHPDVLEVAVFGVADHDWGESVAAAVRLRPGAALNEAGIRRVVTEQLERSAAPRRVVFVDDFPRTPTGKIRRSNLEILLSSDS